jgi:hypothetical protein
MKRQEAIQEFRAVALERQRQIEWCSRLWNLAAQQQCGVLRVACAEAEGENQMNNASKSMPNLSIRSLYRPEIEALIKSFCTCQDWSQIRLVVPTEQHRLDQSARLGRLVTHNSFHGTVVLILSNQHHHQTVKSHVNATAEQLESNQYHKLPAGLHSNLCVSNSMLHLDARVYRNAVVSDTFVDQAALLINCSSVGCKQQLQGVPQHPPYGVLSLTVGPESGGGRDLTVTAESTMMDVCDQLVSRNKSKILPSLSSTHVAVAAHMTFNILSPHSIVRDTPTIENVYLYAHASIHAATSVSQATLHPHATICNACTVSQVLLQWTTSIEDHSIITKTILMEQAAAGPHSFVANSVLGPDVHVSAGEIHASLIGPNTNAHHQSLLIGVLWPAGRGNVGYGANVGSNHTGRLPDQETAAAEGTFWGLSCVVKMPVNLIAAPYSIVAAGTVIAPGQNIAMPFSLLVDGSILPGWVCHSSPYTLARSATKFATRRKAVRHSYYTGWQILRPQVVEQCVWARQALMSVDAATPTTTVQPVYKGDKEIPGIGSHNLTEKGRQTGIRAYTDCIQRFTLQGFLTFLTNAKKQNAAMTLDDAFLTKEFVLPVARVVPVSHAQDGVGIGWGAMPWDEVDESGLWNYQRNLLLKEFPSHSNSTGGILFWAKQLLLQLVALEKDYADRVHQCKERDDTRGTATIPGYEDSHVAAEHDPVIQSVRATFQQTQEAVHSLLSDLEQGAAQISRL